MEIEEQARSEGWVPKEEWKGDPDVWVEAETFVKRGRELAPILSAKNKRLLDELEKAKADIESLKSTSEEFRKIANKSIEKSRKERDDAIAALERQRADAITKGDGDAVIKTERQIKALESENIEPPDTAWKTEATQWAKNNAWYVQTSGDYDEERRIYADGITDIIMRELPHLKDRPREYFQELSRRVEKKFEQRNENREKTTVEQGGSKSKSNGSKSFDSLPEDAKSGFAQMKQLFPDLTEDEYLKNYSWE